jgi:hypothetical protein
MKQDSKEALATIGVFVGALFALCAVAYCAGAYSRWDGREDIPDAPTSLGHDIFGNGDGSSYSVVFKDGRKFLIRDTHEYSTYECEIKDDASHKKVELVERGIEKSRFSNGGFVIEESFEEPNFKEQTRSDSFRRSSDETETLNFKTGAYSSRKTVKNNYNTEPLITERTSDPEKEALLKNDAVSLNAVCIEGVSSYNYQRSQRRIASRVYHFLQFFGLGSR